MESNPTLQPGQLIARGTARHLRQHDFVCIEEFVPTSGLRVDLMALGPKSEIWVVECKSSRADFMSDSKWQGYLEWCDRFFWAVPPDFPTELLPDDTGLIIADAYDAEIIRPAPEQKLAAARRKKMLLKFARIPQIVCAGLWTRNPAKHFADPCSSLTNAADFLSQAGNTKRHTGSLPHGCRTPPPGRKPPNPQDTRA